jgi:peptidoglycan/LPS O-acetylase OafA/YrhL
MWAGLTRIVWPYLIWSVVYYAVVYVRRDETYTILGHLKNLVVGYPYHFVPLLLFFYVLSPLLVRFAKRWGWLLIAIIALYQAILMNVQFAGILGFRFPDWMKYVVPPVVGYALAEWGIYFPLGLVYGLHFKSLLPWLRKGKWVFLGATCLFFLLGVLSVASVVRFPLALHICRLTLVLLLPVIKRKSIPLVRRLEDVGKKSYGLYLTHLLVLDFAFLGVQVLLPSLLNHPILVVPILFTAGVLVPILVMSGVARLPARTVYRYVFG